MGNSFTSFSGSEIAFALLFPMETLFESYVATKLREAISHLGYTISVQDRRYHLFDEPRKFRITPDIVIRDRESKHVFVMDTKWKLLSDTKLNYGISQSDMYQMYVYQKKYAAENVTLLYPCIDKIDQSKDIRFISHEEHDRIEIKIRFVDLFDIKKSLENIIAEISSTGSCSAPEGRISKCRKHHTKK